MILTNAVAGSLGLIKKDNENVQPNFQTPLQLSFSKYIICHIKV